MSTLRDHTLRFASCFRNVLKSRGCHRFAIYARDSTWGLRIPDSELHFPDETLDHARPRHRAGHHRLEAAHRERARDPHGSAGVALAHPRRARHRRTHRRAARRRCGAAHPLQSGDGLEWGGVRRVVGIARGPRRVDCRRVGRVRARTPLRAGRLLRRPPTTRSRGSAGSSIAGAVAIVVTRAVPV